MEPVTHFLFGASMARAGLNRRTAYATLMLTLAAEMPDLDVLWEVRGPVEAFQHHRGWTHSFIGAPIDSAIVLAFVYLYHRWRKSRGHSPPFIPRWGLLFGYGILAVLSHILLDFTNNYGVRPLLPFNWKWYSWDIVFIVEPVILGALALGLLLPSIFGLVGSEVGAKRDRFRGTWSARIALLLICAMWLVRDHEHRRALAILNSSDYNSEVAMRAGAMPYPVNPFLWSGLVETHSAYAVVPVDARNPLVQFPDKAQVFYKPEETPVTLAAKRSRLGHAYLDWSQYPVTESERLAKPQYGYFVMFRDLRFAYSPLDFGLPPRGNPTLSVGVELDSNLRVTQYRVGRREEEP
jgi:inner membrane protein